MTGTPRAKTKDLEKLILERKDGHTGCPVCNRGINSIAVEKISSTREREEMISPDRG